MANYGNLRIELEQLLSGNLSRPATFLKGESGYGKSYIIGMCCETAPASSNYIIYDCKASKTSVEDFLSICKVEIGPEHLPNFIGEIDELGKGIKVTAENIRQAGDNNYLSMVLNVSDNKSRELRIISLTETLIGDLERLPHKISFVIDSFEKASKEFSDWVSGTLLPRSNRLGTVNIILSGQSVPDTNNLGWGRQCVVHELLGVNDPKEWLKVANDLGRKVDCDESELDLMKGICLGTQGHPILIRQIIEMSPEFKVKSK